MIRDPEAFLRRLFEGAVAAADPMRVVARHLPPKPAGRVLVVGAGKASARMAEAVEAAWGPCEGLVITRYGYARPTEGIEIVEAAHPVPDAAGVKATRRMLELLETAGEADFVLALISGGGSALLCAPAGGITLAEKQALAADLLASGAPIGTINAIRREISAVKGGRLAAAAWPARMLSLMISDVPGDDPADIASGPTVGRDGDPEGALKALAKWQVTPPPSVAAYLVSGGDPVQSDDPRLGRVENRVIAAPAQSLEAAAALAGAEGAGVEIGSDALEGEAAERGAELARAALRRQALIAPGDTPVVQLTGGECTVTHRGTGTGGPNAEFTLAAMLELGGAPGVHVLACDTDGVDGAAEVAGAVAGPDTLAAAKAAGLDAEAALAAHDSHGFFAAAGAQVVTGPTLTNVNDFRAFLIFPPG